MSSDDIWYEIESVEDDLEKYPDIEETFMNARDILYDAYVSIMIAKDLFRDSYRGYEAEKQQKQINKYEEEISKLYDYLNDEIEDKIQFHWNDLENTLDDLYREYYRALEEEEED